MKIKFRYLLYMDENVKILLGSTKNIKSVTLDTFNKIELCDKRALIHEYDIRNVLSATEIFDAEREANEIYRIYGKIEYMSLFNGLKNNYLILQDFFLPETTGTTHKDIFNSFDFYLVKPATSGYTYVSGITGTSTITYIRYFEVIATPNEFEIYPAGFGNNVYGEQTYAFNFTEDFDVSNYFDNFGFPVTELFIYAQYKKATFPVESISATTWSHTTGISGRTAFQPTQHNIGDILKTGADNAIGDVIEYSDSQFFQAQKHPQIFYISTPYTKQIITYTYINIWIFVIPVPHVTTVTTRLIWKYNPFMPLPLRYFGNQLMRANISGTTYDVVSSIPAYATEYPVNTGNYVWRNILPQGYFDPITDQGVDYPFVNKRRYLFSNILFYLTPDLNDQITREAFEEIRFPVSTLVNKNPNDDLNNIGKPCQ